MLLDLSSGKFRVASSFFGVPDKPTKLFPYEQDRLVVQLVQDQENGTAFVWGRDSEHLQPMSITNAGVGFPLELYGPDPIWITGTTGTVFHLTQGYWQAVYRL